MQTEADVRSFRSHSFVFDEQCHTDSPNLYSQDFIPTVHNNTYRQDQTVTHIVVTLPVRQQPATRHKNSS